MSFAELSLPPRVPRSIIFPWRHRNACVAPEGVLVEPTISPRSLIAVALLVPPEPLRVPRSIAVLVVCAHACGAATSPSATVAVATTNGTIRRPDFIELNISFLLLPAEWLFAATSSGASRATDFGLRVWVGIIGVASLAVCPVAFRLTRPAIRLKPPKVRSSPTPGAPEPPEGRGQPRQRRRGRLASGITALQGRNVVTTCLR